MKNGSKNGPENSVESLTIADTDGGNGRATKWLIPLKCWLRYRTWTLMM
jgi:hypothetical protein